MSDGARRGYFRADDFSAADVEIQIAALDQQSRLPGVSRLREWSLSALAPRPGDRVLDIGAGTGDHAAELAAEGAEVTGLDPNPVTVLLCGANPGVRLFDGDVVTAFASVWTVDWSTHGAGTALVLWHDGRVRVAGADPVLAEWLAGYFVRHFPEVSGLPWPAPEVVEAPVTVELDLASGLTAHGGGIAVTMSGVLGRRTFRTDDFPLDGVPHRLQLLLAPVDTATITLGGRRLPGDVLVDGTAERPSSSAFLATAEVWAR